MLLPGNVAELRESKHITIGKQDIDAAELTAQNDASFFGMLSRGAEE